MIEEAAGTRMFEIKKNNALKTIEKKDWKLEEIKNFMNDEINPQLNKRKEVRSKYIKYNETTEQVQKLEHFIRAFEYDDNQKKMRK